jgi:phosphoribosyl 1,2-cyclic phosphodiesterase
MGDNNSSNLVFWGVRGTCPVSGENRNKYGGHTPCASLEMSDGSILIIDSGTGIKELGNWIVNEKAETPSTLHIFLTHFHLDHIMGIPFFDPLYSPDIRLIFYSDILPQDTERHLSGFMGGIYFPVPFEQTESEKIFRQMPEQGLEIGFSRITCCPLHHPQGSIAYKIQDENNTIVFATDTEHPSHGIDHRLADFSAGADILVYDATFTPDEYEAGRVGWGHSTWLEGTKLAKQAGVKKLFLSHLNPDHLDSQIDELVSLAHEKFPETYVARERSG